MKAKPEQSLSRSRLKKTLFRTLKEAGALLKRSISKIQSITYKSESNLVTHTDRQAEELIIRRIRRDFPNHDILAEEATTSGRKPPLASRRASPCKWIVDPLDGTTNFAHTFPVACVSIAFEREGEVILGGVFDPYRNELFFAEKNRGATLNSKRIRVSRVMNLRESLLCTGFPYDRKYFAETYLRIFGAYMTKSHGIRRTGSAAIDICYVACGRFDGFWELKLNPWDTAAASLICEEAGGRLTDFSGRPYSIYVPEVLASNGRIHKEMLRTLRRCYRRPSRDGSALRRRHLPVAWNHGQVLLRKAPPRRGHPPR